MSLRVWLPLNGTLDNQGLDDVVMTNNGATVDNNGKIGKCYSFSSTAIYGEVPNTNTMIEMSGCCWVYLTSLSRAQYLFHLGGVSSYPSKISLDYDNSIRSQVNGKEYNSGITLTVNTWYHIAVIVKNNKVIWYLNGEERASASISGSFTASNHLAIGARISSSAGNTFSFPIIDAGRLNDIRIYDHALSPMEVKQISQGLILHYSLNHNGWGNNNLGLDTVGERTFKNSTLHYNLAQGVPNLIKGQTVTISADLKSSVNNSQLDCYVRSSSQLRMNDLAFIKGVTTQYKRYAKTVVVPDNDLTPAWFTFRSSSGGSGNTTTATFSIKNAKIELGDKATPWSPNSTDDLANLLDINTDIEYDCSGYKNHGIKNGDFEYHSDTPKYNVSTIFKDSYIQSNALPLETKTISLWVKFKELQSGNTYRWFFSQPNLGLQIAYTNGGKNFYTYCRKSGNTTGTRFTNLSGIQIGKWYHFVVIRKTGEEDETPNVRELYINGVKQIPASSNSYNVCLRSDLLIGARADSSKVKDFGKIQMSDFRVYVTELSETDILSLYHNEAYIDNNGNIYGAILRED